MVFLENYGIADQNLRRFRNFRQRHHSSEPPCREDSKSVLVQLLAMVTCLIAFISKNLAHSDNAHAQAEEISV